MGHQAYQKQQAAIKEMVTTTVLVGVRVSAFVLAANPGLLPSNRCCLRNGLDHRNQRPKSMLSNSTGFRGGVHAKSVLGTSVPLDILVDAVGGVGTRP